LSVLVGLAACATAPSPIDDGTPPWLIRHTFPGWNGEPVEVLGAPGPRAVAAFLSLAMERKRASRLEDLGDVLRELPSFYEFHFRPAGADPSLTENYWCVRSWLPHAEWQGEQSKVLPLQLSIFGSFSVRELAMALGDVVWRWPRCPRSNPFFLHLPPTPESWGQLLGRLLREKLDHGMSIDRAWQELQFQNSEELYVLTLLPNEQLCVSWHPEITAEDRLGATSWTGTF